MRVFLYFSFIIFSGKFLCINAQSEHVSRSFFEKLICFFPFASFRPQPNYVFLPLPYSTLIRRLFPQLSLTHVFVARSDWQRRSS